MVSFPFAKINLGLRILRKRADGFHDLETCFFPLPETCDVLEMLPSESGGSLRVEGMDWSEPKEQNLIWKAQEAFRGLEPGFPAQDWTVLKKIPTGGGLGGGSSDAAFALRMMAEKAGWPKDDPRLQELAARLGSDCAYFLHDAACIGTGRGEVLEPFELDLSAYEIRLVFPGIHVSTAQAFSRVQPQVPEKGLKEILRQPVATWKEELVNDFEPSVFAQFPELAEAKEKLYRQGAVYAAMSGSGSTLFGLFCPSKS